MELNKKIHVLIVDDSATVRQGFSKILNPLSFVSHVTVASDPIFAMEKMEKEWPDVIILDIEMPRMDGITFLKKIMEEHPTPVIICSSLTEAGTDTAMQALAHGAVEIITKPQMEVANFIEDSSDYISQALQAAYISRPKVQKEVGSAAIARVRSEIVKKDRVSHDASYRTTDKIIALGASTGGTIAIENILTRLGPDIPGIVIVQHMPEKFTKAFADRLNGICEIEVKEAEDGDRVISGRALIAPGNYHMKLVRTGGHYTVEVKTGPILNHHRPSVDVLFRSVAKSAGANVLGVILTGMGDDGSAGMVEMKEAGAYNIAQDKESSVVWGMPGEAYKRGCVDKLVSLDDMPLQISSHFKASLRSG